MEYIIIKDNSNNDLKKIENLENIEIPYVPIEIIEMFRKDYEFMNKLLDYKRDGTLALLKIYDAVNIYDDNFNLNFEKNVRDWYEFFELLKKYTKVFTLEGLNFYKNKNEKNNNFQIINENVLGPIIEKIFDIIYISYLRKFPYWPETGEQNGYINIDLKNNIEISNIRYYWHFQGTLFVNDTKYRESNNGYFFKVEFNGKPKFQIVCFDLNKLKYLSLNENNLKQYIDMIDNKIIAKKMEFDFDI